MEERFDPETTKKYIQAILDGTGMTVFTKQVKDDLLSNNMMSGDAVNVLRGGKISSLSSSPHGRRYQATTQRMTVEFSLRGHKHGASGAPSELVLETARRDGP